MLHNPTVIIEFEHRATVAIIANIFTILEFVATFGNIDNSNSSRVCNAFQVSSQIFNLVKILLLVCAGDVLSKRWPNTGRIVTAQLSVLLSLPLSCLLLKGLPTHDVGHRTAMRSLYALVMFLFGLCISWCADAPASA